MNYTKKHVVCFVFCLTLVFACTVAFANPQVTIVNKSGHPLYVYDTDGKGTPTPVTKVLTDDKPFKLTLQSTASRKMFFAAGHLTYMETKGVEPDPFNPQVDGNVMFNFLEYTSTGNLYTMDNSYVDLFSYPITLMFSTEVKGVCQAYHEYGFTSFSAIVKALQAQGSPWSDLVWQDPSKKMYRIIGPNKLWPFNNPPPPNVPSNFRDFYAKLPPDGTQLFHLTPQVTNFDGWKYYYQTDPDHPDHKVIVETGYYKALLSASKPDKSGKHGFYISPKDGRAEFTNLHADVPLTITIYPYDK